MANGNSFNWLAFLLGLAIGLWISIVALFLLDFDDDDCCGAGGTAIITYPQPDTAWVPGGSADYYCTNNDEGGAIVVDEGGAIVVDEGGAIVVDEGGAIVVDEGSAVVVDEGAIVPVPGPDQLGRDRQHEEFSCDTNDEGGAIVVDTSGRVVARAMPNTLASERCGRWNGNSVVVDEEGQPIIVDEGGAIVVDEGGAIVVDESADPGNDEMLGAGAPTSDTDLAYCIVATPSSAPFVIRP